MGYSAGLLNKRVVIMNRKEAVASKWGKDGSGVEWEQAGCVWANVEWAKGKAAMNAGALDAYGVVIVRMRWNNVITMRSRIQYDGQTYQILPETFHPDKQANTIQFHAQVIINEK